MTAQPGRRSRRRLAAIDQISAQFDPGGDGAGFPSVAGWILPQR